MIKNYPILISIILFASQLFAANRTENNFDAQKEYVIITNISISGNKITKQHIILRELLFENSDTIPVNKLEELIKKSEQNLKNTSLFNEVKIEAKNWAVDKITVYIELKERWYTWPNPIFNLSDRNFNEWWVNQNRNLNRIDYGIYFVRFNFRGRNETLKFHIQDGYTERFAITYDIPYLNKKQTTGITFFTSFSRNREVAYKTFENKQQFYKDPDKYIHKKFYSGIKYYFRKEIHNKHKMELAYFNNLVDDKIAEINPDYFLNSKTHQQYITLNYEFTIDYRDIISYPLKGYYFESEIKKLGIGIFKDVDLWNVYLTYRKYFQLHKRIFAATGSSTEFYGFGKHHYADIKALGYRSYVRGYEYYVIDGQFYFLTKGCLKYELLPQKKANFRQFPFEQFRTVPLSIYANLYADYSYVIDNYYYENNGLANTSLIGYGLGLDFVSFYDKILRIEYSINKLGEKGLYLHFSMPI